VDLGTRRQSRIGSLGHSSTNLQGLTAHKLSLPLLPHPWPSTCSRVACCLARAYACGNKSSRPSVLRHDIHPPLSPRKPKPVRTRAISISSTSNSQCHPTSSAAFTLTASDVLHAWLYCPLGGSAPNRRAASPPALRATSLYTNSVAASPPCTSSLCIAPPPSLLLYPCLLWSYHVAPAHARTACILGPCYVCLLRPSSVRTLPCHGRSSARTRAIASSGHLFQRRQYLCPLCSAAHALALHSSAWGHSRPRRPLPYAAACTLAPYLHSARVHESILQRHPNRPRAGSFPRASTPARAPGPVRAVRSRPGPALPVHTPTRSYPAPRPPPAPRLSCSCSVHHRAPALACSCAPTGQRRSAPHTAATSTCCRAELRLPCSRAARAHQCAARACLRGAAAAARRPRAPRTACCRLGRPPPEPERTVAQAPRTTSADQRLPSPAPERAQAARSPLGAAAACRTPAPSFALGPSRAARPQPPACARACAGLLPPSARCSACCVLLE
jgi:hypothetical protein